MSFDTIVAGGTIVTASDTFRSDIGITAGRIVAMAEHLEGAAERIDATGLLVMPGGIDSHVHLAQPGAPGIVMADDFHSGTRSAAIGGNTMVLPFCLQQKGQTLREALIAYQASAEGRCHTDVAFHLIVTDPTPQVLGQELPALIAEGYTSIKIFMTYDDMKLADREILDVLDVARRHRALVMVHAEGYDAIRFLTERLEREGKTAPFFHGPSRTIPVEREATHRAISFAEIVDTEVMIVHVSNREAMEEIRRPAARPIDPRRDVPAIPGAHRKGHGPRRHGGRQVCLQPAAARHRQPTRLLGRAPAGRVRGLLVRPLPLSLRGRGRQARAQGQAELPLCPQRHPRHRHPHAHPLLRGCRERPH